MTYDFNNFEEIFALTIDRIKVFRYELEEARKTLNMLITINYIIKHGATAFVDELRDFIGVFQKYQTLQALQTYQDELQQQKLSH